MNDDNFLYFITDKLTKSNIYPPLELSRKLTRKEILESWQNLIEQKDNDDYHGHTFGLYLHFPFCPSKCSFCYCPSFAENDFNKIKAYTDRMMVEINFFSTYLKKLKVKTLYVGGGTPSHLPLESIKQIFELIFENFNMQKENWQFNFEASPQSLTKEKIDLLKSLGVNRLSMGVQSLYGKVLKNIDRTQSFNILKEVVNYSREVGIKHINLDYVAGLPGESLASFLKGFGQVVTLKPDIIHLYPFSPTPDTRYIQEGNKYNENEVLLRGKMIKIGEKVIRNAGYKELKNESWGFSVEARNDQDAEKKEVPCSVLGFGSYARSNISKILHYRNTPNHYNNPQGYESEGCFLNHNEEMRHFLMGSFRGGFHAKDFENIFKVNVMKEFNEQFEYLNKLGKLKNEEGFIRMMTDNTNEYHFLCKKLFYSDDVLNKLKLYFKDVYDPSENYQKVFNNKFDSNF